MFVAAGTYTETPQPLGVEVRPGSESRADAKEGYPGTWEISLSPCLGKPEEGTRSKQKSPARAWCAPTRMGAKPGGRRCSMVSAARRKRNAVKRTVRSRSAFTVPEKRGNHTRRDPVEEREASDRRTVGGKHERIRWNPKNTC